MWHPSFRSCEGGNFIAYIHPVAFKYRWCTYTFSFRMSVVAGCTIDEVTFSADAFIGQTIGIDAAFIGAAAITFGVLLLLFFVLFLFSSSSESDDEELEVDYLPFLFRSRTLIFIESASLGAILVITHHNSIFSSPRLDDINLIRSFRSPDFIFQCSIFLALI